MPDTALGTADKRWIKYSCPQGTGGVPKDMTLLRSLAWLCLASSYPWQSIMGGSPCLQVKTYPVHVLLRQIKSFTFYLLLMVVCWFVWLERYRPIAMSQRKDWIGSPTQSNILTLLVIRLKVTNYQVRMNAWDKSLASVRDHQAADKEQRQRIRDSSDTLAWWPSLPPGPTSLVATPSRTPLHPPKKQNHSEPC